MLSMTPNAPPTGTSSDASGVFALLTLISDPSAYQAKLKELSDRVAQVAQAEQVAKAANVEMEAARKRAEDAQFKTEEALRQLAATEADLKAREQKLSDQIAAVYQREKEFEVAKQAFDKQSASTTADYINREAALRKAEEDQKERFAQQQKDIENILQTRRAQLEAEYSQRLDGAAKAQAEAKQLLEDTRQKAIAATKAVVDQTKALYESKLAELRSLGG